jgi:hypothetical protein
MTDSDEPAISDSRARNSSCPSPLTGPRLAGRPGARQGGQKQMDRLRPAATAYEPRQLERDQGTEAVAEEREMHARVELSRTCAQL